MGRCYEFGVAVEEGCEHAMVVIDDGGACGCAECGARCTGRFNACASIIAQPGYVPVNAPKVGAPAAAVEPATRTRSVPDEAPTPVRVQGEIVAVRSMLEALLDRPDRTADAVQLISHELAVRDQELASAFDRLTNAFERIADQVSEDRDAREQVVAAVRELAERIAALEETNKSKRNPLFGFRREA
ncbi:MAG TPA: hypothetical protein VM345_02540 [Acidimicrobiales bacterium]|jgi:hypothetical protein|nr:hypothetical protein [Acidimicrobiales bacterium]